VFLKIWQLYFKYLSKMCYYYIVYYAEVKKDILQMVE